MLQLPPDLKKGDTIGITCPSGYMATEKIETCVQTLTRWGYKVRIGKTIGSESTNYFSGTDAQRLMDFQEMLDDDSVNAILCGRGGYGLSRIIDAMDFKRFKRNPKWIIGFSDITVLHAHINSRHKIATLHAPMAGAFNGNGFKSSYVTSLRDALAGKKADYSCAPHKYNKQGTISGQLTGGNLTLLAHLIGSPSDLDTRGKILFIEDIGEFLYSTDRMLYQMKRSGKLSGLAGLIVGGFSDMKDTERPFGKSVFEIVSDAVAEYDFPVCMNFPVSHTTKNYALKCGADYLLTVEKKKVTLTEL